jgi:diacylglycerol O-acyltransferase/trehalose O-mycolyltransferase
MHEAFRVKTLSSLVGAVLVLAGCASGASPKASATLAATETPVVMPTFAPGSSHAPAIGAAADDGARIIAVDTNPPNLLVPTPRIRDLTIDSPAVGGIVRVWLLLPTQFDAQPSTRWPVLYVLPGSDGGHQEWAPGLDDETLTATTDLLIVMPDANEHDFGGASYSDWWNGGKGGPPMWETFHLVELRQLLERNWHAGDKRAIVGGSAGGYGAMEYATRRPGMFLFAGAYSGVFHPAGDQPTSWGKDNNTWGDPFKQADVWKAHDPLLNAEALRGTALYVAYGNGQPGPLDDAGATTDSTEEWVFRESEAFVQRLAELNIPATVYAYGNGTHTGPYFVRNLHNSLPFILRALGL